MAALLKLVLSVLVIDMMLMMACKVRAADESQVVRGLKGQPSVSFKQYAGYVTVNESHGRALFYWFFEADHEDAANLPLALWLNGGPGCSSVGNGGLAELGPFFVNDSGDSLYINNNSWTKAANIIFLESPFGTGFSYSNTSADYDYYGDDLIAEDAYAFILGWFQKFPEYQKNDFYLVGESYAGHYIPTLARLVVNNNKQSTSSPKINFKGFAIGNPWTSAEEDNKGTTDFYYTHSIISDETYSSILASCDFATLLPGDSSNNEDCKSAVQSAYADMQNIDMYNVYGYKCSNDDLSTTNKSKNKAYSYSHVYTTACSNGVDAYLNDPAVQSSLHVNVGQTISWSGCSNTVTGNYDTKDILNSMLPTYQQLLQEGLTIWIYSGDVDGVVSTEGTRQWINKLMLPVKLAWYPWKFTNQVGGWTEQYSGLTLATVRGAGHLVPATRPEPALLLFQTFLSGQQLPTF